MTPDTFLAIVTIPAACIVAGWLLSGRFSVGTMRHLFFLVIAYYALCVPLDLVVGFELRGGREFLADLNDPLFRTDIAIVLIWYGLTFVGFCAAYHLGGAPGPRVEEQGGAGTALDELPLPPLWLALGINAACLVVYLAVFEWMPRIDRLFLARQATFYKLVSLVVTLTYAFNFLYVLRQPDRRAARWMVAASLVFSLYSGGRMWGAAMVLFYLVRYRVVLRRWQAAALGGTFVLASLVWKELAYRFWETGRFGWGGFVDDVGLSRLEGIQSWVMAVEIFRDGPCPWWWGWSYAVLPLELTWPRFLLEHPPATLSEQYALAWRPTLFEMGGGIGFSAVGEAWLNFGKAGPFLLGAVWGRAARFFDRRPPGPATIVFFLLTVRLFRSDFGSLYKSWIVLFGVALWLVLVLWRSVSAPAASTAWGTAWRRGGRAPAAGGGG